MIWVPTHPELETLLLFLIRLSEEAEHRCTMVRLLQRALAEGRCVGSSTQQLYARHLNMVSVVVRVASSWKSVGRRFKRATYEEVNMMLLEELSHFWSSGV